jgi:hypothetical protein
MYSREKFTVLLLVVHVGVCEALFKIQNEEWDAVIADTGYFQAIARSY